MQENQDLLSEVIPTESPWALVTGASKGIGRGIALGLAKRGWSVAINYYQDRKNAEETQALIEQVGTNETLLLQADVGEAKEVANMFETLDEVAGGLDLLVNNAGRQTWAPLIELSESDWDRTVKTNLKGTFLCTQQAARRMTDGLGGGIINIGSGGSKSPFPGFADLCATKAGIEQLTRISAIELGPHGIRVNSVAPGCIAVERTNEENPDFEGTWKDLTPLRNIGDPVDIADAVCFLASREARFINGQTLYIDGGLWSQVPWPFDSPPKQQP